MAIGFVLKKRDDPANFGPAGMFLFAWSDSMTRKISISSCIGALLVTGLFAAASPSSDADETNYSLRYKLSAGETLRYRVEHQAKTKVRVSDTEELSEMRTVSQKIWQVTDVNAAGEITFENGIESVEMSQQAGDKEEIRWSSESDAIPPVQFGQVAKRLGKVLATITINPQGQVTQRSGDGATDTSGLGMGDVTMPLPVEPIKVGGKWSVPREVKVKNEEGLLKLIKIRELYTLEKVQSGVATIEVRSEPLTPIDDQQMRGQLVQQLSNGTVRFDIDAGRIISRQLDWDEEVVGFQGAASNLQYTARLTEMLERNDAATATLQPLLRR
jgi:hypothetical protein